MAFDFRNRVLKHIPNTITLARFVMTVVFLGMVLYSPRVEDLTLWMDWAFVLFVMTGLTDAIDGKLARMFEVTSKFGRVMDPLADKVLVCGSFICFAVIARPILFPEVIPPALQHVIHWGVAIIIILREAVVTYIRQTAEARGISFAANAWGKLKMFIQAFGIGNVVIKMAHVPEANWGMWFTAVTFTIMIVATVMSGVQYVTRREARQAGLGF